MVEKQEKWTQEMYKICCEEYLFFLKGYYENIGAGRGVLINKIIDKLQDSLNVKISKIEDVDEKLQEIQVLVNEYYPVYKEPVGISYSPSDKCLNAFISVVDEIENPKPQAQPQTPRLQSTPQNTKSMEELENFIAKSKTQPKPQAQPEPPIYITIEEIIKRIKWQGVSFNDRVVPRWSDLKVGDEINHCGLGRGKIVEKTDNRITQRIKLEFVIGNTNDNKYRNSFIYPMAFETGLLLQSEILLKRLNKV